jgi:hypothetical protein
MPAIKQEKASRCSQTCSQRVAGGDEANATGAFWASSRVEGPQENTGFRFELGPPPAVAYCVCNASAKTGQGLGGTNRVLFVFAHGAGTFLHAKPTI